MPEPHAPYVVSLVEKGEDRDETEYECFEGCGGYFDGTIFEVPATMAILVLTVSRSDEDGGTLRCDRYLYRLDDRTYRAEFVHADTVEHSSEG